MTAFCKLTVVPSRPVGHGGFRHGPWNVLTEYRDRSDKSPRLCWTIFTTMLAEFVTNAVVKVPVALISAGPPAAVEWATGAMRVASNIKARLTTNANRT